MKELNSLSEAVNYLTKQGYTEDFVAQDKFIKALYSKKEYTPSELKIIETYRFEAMSNPDDEAELFGLEAKDGTKGTLVMSFSADHNQNVELIKELKNQ